MSDEREPGAPPDRILFRQRCKDPKCPYFDPGRFHMHLDIPEPNVVGIDVASVRFTTGTVGSETDTPEATDAGAV